MRRLLLAAALTVALTPASSPPALAAVGEVDPTWHAGSPASLPALFRARLVPRDAGAVVVAERRSADVTVAVDLVGLGADGGEDAGFGGNGTAEIAPASAVYDAGRDEAGRVYVLYEADGLVLARFTAQGALDSSFGAGGKVAGFPPATAARVLGVGPDGSSAVAAGSWIVRITSAGARDASFGSNGGASTARGIAAGALAVDGIGRVVVYGTYTSSQPCGRDICFVLHPVLARQSSTGAVDVGFRSAGADELPADGRWSSTGRLDIDGGGSMTLLAGGVARTTEGGALDSSFGVGGIAVTPSAPIAVAADGWIYGARHYSETAGTLVERATPLGAKDGAFGRCGVGFLDAGLPDDARAVGNRLLVAAPSGAGLVVAAFELSAGPANPYPAGLAIAATSARGGVSGAGPACFAGSMRFASLRRPIVGLATTPSLLGYWLVASDGGVFAFGDAAFRGSTGNLVLNRPVVGMARTPDGAGYWLVASDGGVFAFGSAAFYGSTGGLVLNKPVVGVAPTPSGHGYWLVASDGGVFAFGDAAFSGSTGGIALNRPVVGMAPAAQGGYWLVASDGGVFSFGAAPFHGSLPGSGVAATAIAIVANSTAEGYWIVSDRGAIWSYGGARPQLIVVGATGDERPEDAAGYVAAAAA